MLSFATRSLLRAPLLRAATPRAAMRIPLARIAPVSPAAVRMYSAGSLSKDDISTRILDVLKSFDKATPDKITTGASFTELGFDSLDSVEVVMAIEEEFNIEIPDAEADEITTVPQAIEYIAKTPEAS